MLVLLYYVSQGAISVVSGAGSAFRATAVDLCTH
jgi:hypothetical protein